LLPGSCSGSPARCSGLYGFGKATRENTMEDSPLRMSLSWSSLGLTRGPHAKPIVVEVNERGCHICVSHAARNKRARYPTVKVDGRVVSICRLLVIANLRPLEKGELVRHTCDDMRCINLLHLLPGTPADNARDKALRGRSRNGHTTGNYPTTVQRRARSGNYPTTVQRRARSDGPIACSRGHVLATPGRCAECKRMKAHENYLANREAVLARSKERYQANREAILARAKQRYLESLSPQQ
jgi:hypothetical protein